MISTFHAFSSALHGRPPFPWQTRLAEEVLATGWPDLLDLPTGSGKTSALDVALYCLAMAPDRMPRRTLLVVDRRIVVDQGAEHARGIADRLKAAKDGALKETGDALRRLWAGGTDEAPLEVAVMRGGMPRDNDWAKRPDRPMLGVSTVDQVGSRLLFRGYGVSPRSASIHAGLLGNDTLILLDEVHLAVPFAETLEAISSRYRRAVGGLPDRFGVVRMSATAGSIPAGSRRFTLGPEDRADPVLKRRLGASKLATLVAVKATGDDEATKRAVLARAAVEHALRLQKDGAKVVGVVVNRVDTARLAAAELEGRDGTDVILVTGRMRPIDRDRLVRTRLLPRAGAGRRRTPEDRPTVVVATQCIEAGADLDFDALVTECASVDALRQRFGRLDRRGELARSPAVVLMRSDLVGEDDPIYGRAMASTWEWLLAHHGAGPVDFGIDSMPVVEDPSLLAPVLNAPVMLPAHLDAWSQTSPPARDPDIAPWLHGPRDDAAEVQVVWRSGLGLTAASLELDLASLAACRPSALEAVSLPLAVARRWLGGAKPAAMADVVAGAAEGSGDEERGGLRQRSQDRGGHACLRWGEDELDQVLVSPEDAREDKRLRPGDVLVVRCDAGGLRLDSFDPDATTPVVDLGDLAQLRGRGVISLRLDLEPATDAVEATSKADRRHEALLVWGLGEDELASVPRLGVEASPQDLRQLAVEWARSLPAQRGVGEGNVDGATSNVELATANEWSIFRDGLGAAGPLRASLSGGRLHLARPVPKRRLPRLPEITEAITEDDDSSFRQAEVTLRAHGSDVQRLAKDFSTRLGFSEGLAADVALAAWLHDVGKADARFQRWLVGGSEVRASLQDEPLAKSAFPADSARERQQARQRAGYPPGYRHELLSLHMVAQNDVLARAGDPELVLHLIASHHGHCRPFAPPIDHPDDLPVAFEQGGVRLVGTTRHHMARLDSGVADRYWGLVERYGWWGLAWLEAILRLADHRASELAVPEDR